MLLGALLRRYVEGDAGGFRVRRWRDAQQRAWLQAEITCRLVSSLEHTSCLLKQLLRAARNLPSPACGCFSYPGGCCSVDTADRNPTAWPCSSPLLVLVVAPPVPQDSMTAEAAELATASFGDVMLGAIGGVYKTQADIVLGGFFDGGLVALRHASLTLCSHKEGCVRRPASVCPSKGCIA